MVFARRDGHHTRQPETIQEFPGDSRPSLHKMSSLSIAVYLWGYLPPRPPPRLTPNWFLITDFPSSPRGGRFQVGVGGGRRRKRKGWELEEMGGGGGGGTRRGEGEWLAPAPGADRPRGAEFPATRLHKAGAGGRR